MRVVQPFSDISINYVLTSSEDTDLHEIIKHVRFSVLARRSSLSGSTYFFFFCDIKVSIPYTKVTLQFNEVLCHVQFVSGLENSPTLKLSECSCVSVSPLLFSYSFSPRLSISSHLPPPLLCLSPVLLSCSLRGGVAAAAVAPLRVMRRRLRGRAQGSLQGSRGSTLHGRATARLHPIHTHRCTALSVLQFMLHASAKAIDFLHS